MIKYTIVGGQDDYHAGRLTQTWGTYVEGVELGSKLRARVGDTLWCGAPAK